MYVYDIYKRKTKKITYTDDILGILRANLSEGKLIGSKYFPYNSKKNLIMKLPKFKFDLEDDELKVYKQDILDVAVRV